MSTLIRPEGPSPEDAVLSRRGLAGAVLGAAAFAGYAPAALAQAAQPIVTDAEGLTIQETTYPAPDGFALPAYVARPSGEGPFPVVIVVSEIFGLHAWIQDICRRLAKAGYAAVAPAFFVRVADPAPLTDFAEIQRIVAQAGYEQVMGDISATLAWADQQLWADSDHVGITGYCWGGKVVWQAAARFAAIDAGVAWYGRLAPPANATPEQRQAGAPWPVDVAAELKGPVIGLYGGQDRGIPLDTVEQMRAALARAGAEGSEMVVYPDAEHGFQADYRAGYDAQAAEDGWRRLLAHFETYLKS
ncbi:MAG: dienelactone hydrolase family protein [Brevundimonas sp.]